MILPDEFQPPTEQEVIVLFEEDGKLEKCEKGLWEAANHEAFVKVWDNPEDAVYDTL